MTALAPSPYRVLTSDPEPVAAPRAGTSPVLSAMTHEIRREILECVSRGIDTPKGIADEVGRPLGVVSYHVRMLRDYGVLEHARSEPRRGALQHFYGFSADALADLEQARDLINQAIRLVRRGPSAEEVRDAA